MTCSLDGCERPVKTRGLCQAHYMRWWSTGDVRPDVPLGTYRRSPAERLTAKTEIMTNGCWRYLGPTSKGYGYVRSDKRRPVLAHRLAYELAKGPIPFGLDLDHLCHTRDKTCRGGVECEHRRCVNPDHLEPVTQSENAKRGRIGDRARERAAKITHCPRGHEYGTGNFYIHKATGTRVCKDCTRERGKAKTLAARGLPDPRRTSEETVRHVRELLPTGMMIKDIAAAAGTSSATVIRIRDGASWFGVAL